MQPTIDEALFWLLRNSPACRLCGELGCLPDYCLRGPTVQPIEEGSA